jgi:hypothetical protein
MLTAVCIKVMVGSPLVMILRSGWRRCTANAAVKKIFFRVNFPEINRSRKNGTTPAIFLWHDFFFVLVSVEPRRKRLTQMRCNAPCHRDDRFAKMISVWVCAAFY